MVNFSIYLNRRVFIMCSQFQGSSSVTVLFICLSFITTGDRFVFSLFVPHLFFCWCLGRAGLHGCGLS